MEQEIIILIAVGTLVIGGLSLAVLRKQKSKDLPKTKPTNLVPNDKLVIVQSVALTDLKQAVQQFCKLYNAHDFAALPQLHVYEQGNVIRFPFDISFEVFCYFINYLNYPEVLGEKPDYQPNVKGYCIVLDVGGKVGKALKGQAVMMYCDFELESEAHDSVFVTTEAGESYMLGFAMGEELRKWKEVILPYKQAAEFGQELEAMTFE